MKASSLLLVLLFSAPISAQITVTGLTEMQRGEVPGSDSTAISTAYNQLNLDFTQKGLQAGLRAEIYNTWGADRETYQITQKYARWNHGAANVEIGNYYAILGRGLTLRAFELPGVVLESPIYRLRYAPAQDLEGATASWTGNRVVARALIGRSALSDIPPGAKTGIPPRSVSRRGDWVTGGELAIRLNLPTSELAARAFTSRPKIPSSIKIGPGLALSISTFLTFCKRPVSTAAFTANTRNAKANMHGEKTTKKELPFTYRAIWAGTIWG